MNLMHEEHQKLVSKTQRKKGIKRITPGSRMEDKARQAENLCTSPKQCRLMMNPQIAITTWAAEMIKRIMAIANTKTEPEARNASV